MKFTNSTLISALSTKGIYIDDFEYYCIYVATHEW